MNRKMDKAGTWYSDDKKELQKEVAECLRKGIGEYGRALDVDEGRPSAVMVPHAGLFFSGALAALAFELVRRRWEQVDTFVLFGACHRERLRKPAIWAEGEWETPLGGVTVDDELSSACIDAGVGEKNYTAHEGDNSLELQLPFIKSMFPDSRIVPVAVGFFPDAWRYGELAAGVVKKLGRKNVVAVASTDLTHYGASFGVMPAGVGDTALSWAKENDERFLDAVTEMRFEDMVSIAEQDRSACGAGAVAAAAGWARAFGCTGGRVLARTDSHESMPRGLAEHFVGYGVVTFPVDG